MPLSDALDDDAGKPAALGGGDALAGDALGADRPTYGVPPVTRAIKVLRHVASGHGCTNISAASKALGINRTTLIRLLHTLAEERMIEWQGEGRGYRLGYGLLGLAAEALSSRDLLQVARPHLAELAQDTGLSAHLGVLDGREVVYMIREVPRSQLVSNVREGTRLPAHATTMGRMLLAHLTAQQLFDLYSGTPMPEYSSVTATTPGALFDQLQADRARGIVWSDGNFEPMIGSCACPVLDHGAHVVASINLSGPNEAFIQGAEVAQRIDQAIRDCAEGISEALGWRGPQGADRT
ncbi:IclR family transcriptional regulator [Pseudooceanicola algae]|uniref:HTH-type transcriptional regulator XynR n=1 Tax=Pseudooceanicola algae TaxID=1537215 RepID=A0A418SJW9_9RHOB|nr:IclR family transcriptional regulator [Pseudooceanicola algae]QPM92232.1 HTH-type transcriptional regulator XynR [Pseudooceanicola algae]